MYLTAKRRPQRGVKAGSESEDNKPPKSETLDASYVAVAESAPPLSRIPARDETAHARGVRSVCIYIYFGTFASFVFYRRSPTHSCDAPSARPER